VNPLKGKEALNSFSLGTASSAILGHQSDEDHLDGGEAPPKMIENA
jgi:hypothetical protein